MKYWVVQVATERASRRDKLKWVTVSAGYRSASEAENAMRGSQSPPGYIKRVRGLVATEAQSPWR